MTSMDDLEDQKDQWTAAMKAQGHIPRMDSDLGGLDIFVCDTGFHNGPGCETCYSSWCMHCDSPEDVEPCTSGVLELKANPVVRRIK